MPGGGWTTPPTAPASRRVGRYKRKRFLERDAANVSLAAVAGYEWEADQAADRCLDVSEPCVCGGRGA